MSPMNYPISDSSGIRIADTLKSKKGDKSVRVRIPECNIMFNFIPYPFSNYVYIHMRTYDPCTIQYFSLVDEQLKKAVPNYNSTFFRGRGKSKTLVCQIPIDKE